MHMQVVKIIKYHPVTGKIHGKLKLGPFAKCGRHRGMPQHGSLEPCESHGACDSYGPTGISSHGVCELYVRAGSDSQRVGESMAGRAYVRTGCANHVGGQGWLLTRGAIHMGGQI